MGICQKYNIKQELSDEKNMINEHSKTNYLPKDIEAICEVILTDGLFVSGFFCKIPYTQNNNLILPVLITKNSVLSRYLLNCQDYINIIINGETKVIPLKNRKIWTDEKIDFTCIEIKEEEDNIYTFFNLDDDVLDNKDSNDIYLNKKVVIFGINKDDKQIVFSNGLINRNKDCFFEYTCNDFLGSSGGCIVNQYNNCVIGIHRGEFENGKINQGIYIKNVIRFIKDFKESITNVKYFIYIF